MVDFVDVFVGWAPVQAAVHPVVPGIFHHEEDQDLVGYLPPGGEGNGGGDSHHVCHGVEEPDLGEFDGEVLQEDEFGAVPLFFC